MEELTDFLVTTPTGTKVIVRTDRYVNGERLAVQLFCLDDEPYATVSINVEGAALAADEFVFKTYLENEGLLEAMLAAGVVELTGRSVAVGPVCRLVTPDSALEEVVDGPPPLKPLKCGYMPTPDWLKGK